MANAWGVSWSTNWGNSWGSGTPAASARGAWDFGDADPFFYEWWRKKQEEANAPRPVFVKPRISEPQAAPANEDVRKEAVAVLRDVRSFDEFDAKAASLRAELLIEIQELKSEYLRLQADEDDVETILLLT